MRDLERIVEALLFLSPEPVTTAELAEACDVTEAEVDRALDLLVARRSLDFDETFGSEDRLTQAVTLFALLEMHKRGEATWTQKELFGPIEVEVAG